ncbi:MAG: primosomal protein N' [Puniceicoccales bacterium]|jgi:primosomal protein N' (replication factor Y)|nr:primosomal protein N' [Puniceicoccales bacterium]
MPETQPTIVEVLPFDGGGRTYSYAVPPTLTGKIRLGQLVRVPLGSSTRIGIVWNADTENTAIPTAAPSSSHTPLLTGLTPPPLTALPSHKLKSILQLCHETPVLSPDLPALAKWISAYYAAPLNSVLETILPASVRHGTRPIIQKKLHISSPLDPESLAKLRRRAPKQAALYDFLASQITATVDRATVLKGLNIGTTTCDALIKAGIIEETSGHVSRDVYADDLADNEVVSATAPILNPSQQSALDDISADLASNSFGVRLLHGVTGSGKTEIYIGAILAALANDGAAIFLVPEVALTPQTVQRLRQRLANANTRVVVWHSLLSNGERFDAWMAMASGKARIVVGARSAVFAPLANLRLIVIDEEHEPAYKQSETPLYNGRDVAIYRARLNNALALPGSATPSLESLANTRSGKYRLSRLPFRIEDRSMPAFRIIDMRRELLHAHGQTILSRPLVDALRSRIERREQSILFLNRRGFSRQMICPACGFVAGCPHCSISLTYHRTSNSLRCHACGYSEPAPNSCPVCHSPKIRGRGAGTQKLEDTIRNIFPLARLARLDADTMGTKNFFRQILSDFRKGKLDILMGTQMLAKGLDFPNVTLVGIIDADISLHMADFRAAERTFQLLVQVAGRAGRGSREGEVLVQTFTPNASPILFAKQSDFDGFFDSELSLRNQYGYPPARHLIRHLFRSRDPQKVAFYAKGWIHFLEKNAPDLVEIRGPAPCPIERLQDNYRWNAWYFTNNVSHAVKHICLLRNRFHFDPAVSNLLDIDTVNLD